MNKTDGTIEQSCINALTILLAAGGVIAIANPASLVGAITPRVVICFATGLILLALIPLLVWTKRVALVAQIGAAAGTVCFFSGFVLTGELFYAGLGITTLAATTLFINLRRTVWLLVTSSCLLLAITALIQIGYWVPPVTPEAFTGGLLPGSFVVVSLMLTLAGSAIWKERLLDQAKERELSALATASIQQQRFEVVCKSAYDAIFEADERGRIVWVNGTLIEQLGYTQAEVIGMRQLSFFSKIHRKKFINDNIRSMRNGGEYSFETQFTDRGGGLHWVRISGGPVASLDGSTRWVTAVSDISEEMTQMARMMERSRLESLGTVCGGLAHDFNNLLTVIGIYGDLVAETQIREAILHAQQQASDVAADLLTFARKQDFRDQNIVVRDLLLSNDPIVQRLLPASIRCDWDIRCGDASVLIDPSQLQQVLINLVNNAEQAMSSSGKLEIVASPLQLDANEAANFAIDPGAYVCIDVVDNGPGMDSETVQRALEPFFTTKPRGEGTGLGLATVHGVARRSGGTVVVKSEVGVGTKVSVILPAQPCQQTESSKQIEDSQLKESQLTESQLTESQLTDSQLANQPAVNHCGASNFSGIGRRILLVEDQDSLAQAVSQVLTAANYHIDTCNDAEQAWENWLTQSPYDLIISDIVLSGMSGVSFLNKLRLTAPDLKAILTSGYQQDDLSIVANFSDTTRFIAKPFKPIELLHAVDEMLVENESVAW